MITRRQQWQKLLSARRQGSERNEHFADRTAFQQDYDRIIFSSAFRRLKDKTQVFPLSRSDYVRTRLTHSLETSCVGRSLGTRIGRELIARHFLSDIDPSDFGAIVAAACLAHDIGNPPFGHAGEEAVRHWFKNNPQYLDDLSAEQRADFLQFEGNAQGFRILTRLQNLANPGLQLTTATLATFSKYPRPALVDPTLFSEDVSAQFSGQSASKNGYFQHDHPAMKEVADDMGLVARIPDCVWHRHPLAFLVEVADDLCYLIVDMEDAARLGFLPYPIAEELLVAVAGKNVDPQRLQRLFDQKERLEYLRAKAIGRLIEAACNVFLDVESDMLSGHFDQAILELVPTASVLAEIKAISNEYIYTARPAIEIEVAGFEIIGGLLSMFIHAIEVKAQTPDELSSREKMLLRLLPAQFLTNHQPNPDPYLRRLQITDFVTGMTDSYAIDLYRKLKGIDLPV